MWEIEVPVNKTSLFKLTEPMTKVITFQSGEVVNILLTSGNYSASAELARERRCYSADMNQLGGSVPVWCFKPLNNYKFVVDDFKDGILLNKFRCELSLPARNTFYGLVMLELEVPTALLKTGITHNSYDCAVVVPHLTLDMLCAIYRCSDTKYFYYKDISIIGSYRGDILFPSGYFPHTVSTIAIYAVVYQGNTGVWGGLSLITRIQLDLSSSEYASLVEKCYTYSKSRNYDQSVAASYASNSLSAEVVVLDCELVKYLSLVDSKTRDCDKLQLNALQDLLKKLGVGSVNYCNLLLAFESSLVN